MDRLEIPLFPLGTVLLPGGRLSLQIFEQRYLTMVKQVMRNDGEFGIIKLRSGREVAVEGISPTFEDVGVTARIVDWDSLPNGLLGIVVEGGERFSVDRFWQQDDQLWMAQVELWPQEDFCELPQDRADWTALLEALATHPHVQRLGLQISTDDAGLLGNHLAQLLPISEDDRYRLMLVEDPLERLDLIHDLLSEFDA